jgi:hypothetical protein
VVGHDQVLPPRLVLPLLLALLAAAGARAGSTLDADQELILFPTSAHLEGASDTWRVPLHGWVFEPERHSAWRALLVHELAARLSPTAAQDRLFRQRVRLFLVDGERGRTVRLQVAGSETTLGPSDSGGHLRGEVRVGPGAARVFAPDGWLGVAAALPAGDERRFAGRVQLVATEGLSVISDIDDTVKVSQVLDRRELLANTFLRPWRAVPGMAELYRRWADRGAAFHYVSASPWRLEPALSDFLREQDFPAGSLHLRAFRNQERSALQLAGDPASFKTPTIESIIRDWPGRRYILVGDTGEQDGRVYASIATRFPEQVLHVALRRVEGAPPLPEALTRLPAHRWTVFSDPAELAGLRLTP